MQSNPTAAAALQRFQLLTSGLDYEERLAELEVKRLTVQKDEALQTVEVDSRPPALETTAVTTFTAQVITKPSPALNVPNSEQYAPAEAGHRKLTDRDILFMDTRPGSYALYGRRGPDMPAVLVTNTFRGVAFRHVRYMKFIGFAQVKLDTTLASKGGEDQVALRLTDKIATRNYGPHGLHAMVVVSFGPPRAKPVYTDGKLDTSKYPKTGIVMLEDAETGDQRAAPPIPRIVNTSAPFQHMHAVLNSLKVDPERTLDTALDAYVHRGDVVSAVNVLSDMYHSWRDDREAGAETSEEMNAIFTRIAIKARSFFPDTLAYLQVESQRAVPSAAATQQLNAAAQPDSYILLPKEYNVHYRNVLATQLAIDPEAPVDAVHCWEAYAARLLRCLKAVGTSAVMPNLDFKANGAYAVLEDVEAKHGAPLLQCVVTKAAADANPPANFELNRLLTMQQRLDALILAVSYESAAGETWICAAQKHADGAHLLVTADSQPGGPLLGLAIRHS